MLERQNITLKSKQEKHSDSNNAVMKMDFIDKKNVEGTDLISTSFNIKGTKTVNNTEKQENVITAEEKCDSKINEEESNEVDLVWFRANIHSLEEKLSKSSLLKERKNRLEHFEQLYGSICGDFNSLSLKKSKAKLHL